MIECVVDDYRYPQTYHEITMTRHGATGYPAGTKGEIGETETKPQLAAAGSDSTAVGMLGAYSLPFDSLGHKTGVVQRENIVDGDQDDKQRFKEYVQVCRTRFLFSFLSFLFFFFFFAFFPFNSLLLSLFSPILV